MALHCGAAIATRRKKTGHRVGGAMASFTASGFWEDSDQLNHIASFLDAKSIGAVSCTCKFARDNLQDGTVLRWLAELRGLDPHTTKISCLEHIELAEAMAELESSIAFGYGSLELEEASIPSVRRVVELIGRHQSLQLSIEAHCGLEAPAAFARNFTRRRAMAVRRSMEEFAEEIGHGPGISGRLRCAAWGNSRPLVWARGEDGGAFMAHQGSPTWDTLSCRCLSRTNGTFVSRAGPHRGG
eukprot:SAG22_NODE_110_length_19679_cov_45.046527_8_plen_242_part_00